MHRLKDKVPAPAEIALYVREAVRIQLKEGCFDVWKNNVSNSTIFFTTP